MEEAGMFTRRWKLAEVKRQLRNSAPAPHTATRSGASRGCRSTRPAATATAATAASALSCVS